MLGKGQTGGIDQFWYDRTVATARRKRFKVVVNALYGVDPTQNER